MIPGGKFFVGIQREDPIAGDVLQRGVASGAEIVAPGERMNFRAEFFGNFNRAIRRSGIHDHDLLCESANRFEALRDEFLLVFHDETDRQANRNRGVRMDLFRQLQPLRARVSLEALIQKLLCAFKFGCDAARVFGAQFRVVAITDCQRNFSE